MCKMLDGRFWLALVAVAGLTRLGDVVDAEALTLGAPITIVNPAPSPALNSMGPNRFGTLVTSIADIDGDGVPDIAVGVPFQDAGQQIPGGFGVPENEGEVFLFSGASRTLIRTLTAPDFMALTAPPKYGGKFGSAVVTIGDVDGDGVPDLAVAAPFRSVVNGLDAVGEIYLFSGKTGGQIRTMSDATPAELAQFGYALAPIWDINGDGIPDLLVSAPFKTVGGAFEAGEVYLCGGADGAIIRTIDAPTATASARFGFSVAAVGDLNHDGKIDFAVGAPALNKVYVYSGANGALLMTLGGTMPAGAGFGTVVASGKDLNGDGLQDILVGAPYVGAAPNARYQGEVFAFSGANGQLLYALNDPVPQSFAEFGSSAALISDLSGDGKPDIIVGAPYQDVTGVVHAGEAFLFNGATGALIQAIMPPQLQSFAGFGFSSTADVFQTVGGLADPLIGVPFMNSVNPPTAWNQINQGQALLYPAQ